VGRDRVFTVRSGCEQLLSRPGDDTSSRIRDADLRLASVRNADLSRAKVDDCDLTSADLRGVNLPGRRWKGRCSSVAT
jgi:uncharacterized protein YjbI with pentapeptide repeats